MSGISHKTTEEEHHPTTECCICYEDCSEQFARGLSYPQNADDLKGKCSHITCRSCIAQYFTLKINEGNIQQEDFNCPEISCGHIIGSDIVPQYVDWEVTKKMELMKISKNPQLAKECCICYEDCTDEYYFKGLSYPTNSDSHDGKKCGHVTCRGCISKYFHFKINERKVQEEDFKCPGVPCDHVIEISTVLKFVNWDEAEKLKRFQREDKLAKDPMNVYCPEPACNAITKKKSLNASVSECHVCQFKFCNYCLGKHHPFQTCSMARDKAYFEWVRQRQRYGEGVKSCPKCKFQIEKTGGCAHMTCKKCNHQFCWGCLSNWVGGCTRKRWCAFVKFNDHHLWGPNPLVRAGTKTAAAVIAIPVGAVAAGIVVVIGTVAVSGALVFGVPVLVIKGVHKHIKEAKQRERMKYFEQSLTRSTKLLSGYRVLLVGFDGFLTKAVDELSGQVPGGKATGRWISGKNRQYLFYDLALGGLSNLVYVEEASTVCCPTLPEGVCTCPGTWDLVVVRPGRPPLLTAWQRAAPHRVAVHEDRAAVVAAAGTEELKDEGGEEEEEKAGEEGAAAAPLEELPPGLEEQALGAFRPSEEAIETLQSPEEVLLASFRFQNKHHRLSLQMPSWGAGRKGKTQRPAAAGAARNKDSKRGTQPISGSVQCSKFTLTELTTLILRSLDESHPLAMG